MFTDLKLSFENFLNSSSACFMFVDGYTGIGKTVFAKQIMKDFNASNNEEVKVLYTQAPYIDSERGFITSFLREEIFLNSNKSLPYLKSILLSKLSICKYMVIDDSQNLLISNKLVMNHFLFMSWLVNQINIKVLYLGTVPFQPVIGEYDTINRRSIIYNLKAS